MLYEIDKFYGRKIWFVLFIYGLFLIYVFISFSNIVYKDTSWTELHEEYISVSKILVIALSVIAAPFFAGENECGMNQVLNVSKEGHRKTAIIKVNTVLFITNIAMVIFAIITILGIGAGYGWHWNTAILEEKLLPYMSDPLTNTNAKLIANRIFQTVLAVNLSALVCLLLSEKIKTSLATAIVMTLLHEIFSSGLLANFLDGIAGLKWLGNLVSFMPVNIIAQYVLHIEKVTIASYTIFIIYICDLLYVLLSVFLYIILINIYDKRKIK